MKIAIFSDSYLDLIGGIRSSIDAQKEALEKNGHEVIVFSTGFPRSDTELQQLEKKHIYKVPSCKLCFRGLTPVSRRPKIIEEWIIKTHPEIKTYDIIYTHYEAGCSIAGLRLGKRLDIPTVQVMHGREDMGETNIIPRGFRTLVASFLNWFHSWYIPHPTKVHRDGFYADGFAKAKMWEVMVNHANYADQTITPSEHFREKLIRYGATKDIKVIPNGYPDKDFPKDLAAKSLSSGSELKMIWHSRVSAEKRMMPFLRALCLVKGKYHLDVYGGGGDYFRAKRFAKNNQLNVIFHGNVSFDQIKEAISDVHLDVLVSYNFDTFGMTLIEAEAYNVPVFICDPDLKETVPPGSYTISTNENIEEMAETLNHLMKHPEKIAKMSEVMQKHRKEILASKRIKSLEKLFNDIIKK